VYRAYAMCYWRTVIIACIDLARSLVPASV